LGVVSSRKQVNLNSLDQWKKLIFYYKLRWWLAHLLKNYISTLRLSLRNMMNPQSIILRLTSLGVPINVSQDFVGVLGGDLKKR
jgi:hypothetical protein